MSKNGKGKGRKSRTTEETAQSRENSSEATPTTPAAPRVRRTIPERLEAKASWAHDTIKEVLKMVSFYGATPEIISHTQQVLVEVDVWRGKVSELVGAGWEPAIKGALKEIALGDKIAIAGDFQKAYSFIPSEVKLIVADIERSENFRVKRILLAEEREVVEGVPSGARSVFGWALLSHIERR